MNEQLSKTKKVHAATWLKRNLKVLEDVTILL